ncbi:hypothetical protein FOY91_03405 [Sphingomonas solaris]|uniref:SGNH hydrolase-type esterase domain-containing protein n=2 Tax=Alterirhizorhabdus solaris TaxID=2529389 RepID=A0A558RBR6_9SPHN|nr:hypothetical protein FOY91_03405 [Sphingomonas solaris]
MAVQKNAAARRARDWPDLCRYRAENAAVLAGGVQPDAIFLGDSITEYWAFAQPDFFGPTRLDRGISGQTTSQILLRVYPDVVALRPRVVHILAGTNDVAGNTGPVPDEVIVDNIRAMIDIAKANGIKVVLAGITPVDTKDRPAKRIAALNVRLRALAAQAGAIYLDYHPALAIAGGAIAPSLANDGLHPNRSGYALMRPLAEQALTHAMR